MGLKSPNFCFWKYFTHLCKAYIDDILNLINEGNQYFSFDFN